MGSAAPRVMAAFLKSPSASRAAIACVLARASVIMVMSVILREGQGVDKRQHRRSMCAETSCMTIPLPPLNAVWAFVKAARHLNFSRAERELHVAHGAVSRQIKRLEEHFGLALFERRVLHVVLTEAGQAFYDQAETDLALIGRVDAALRTGSSSRSVRINVRP